jgi:hypothetical protein
MPKYTTSVREVDTYAPYNPIKYKLRKQQRRQNNNTASFSPTSSSTSTVLQLDRPVIFNYGSLPRTWMNPNQVLR